MPRRLLGVFMHVLVCTFMFPVLGQEKSEPFVADCIKGIVETLSSALKNGDVDKAVSVYLDAAEVLVIQPNGAGYHGPDKIREMYAAAFRETKFHDVKFDFKLTHIEDTFGMAYLTVRAILETKADSKKWEQLVQATWLLKEVKGRWFIQVEHFSPMKDIERIRPLDAPDGGSTPPPNPLPETDDQPPGNAPGVKKTP